MYLIIGAEGNEYGITNVSSQGRVSITVVPPRQQASRSRSQTPFDHDFKSRVPPATASNFAGNEVETSSYSQAVKSSTDYSQRLSPSSGVSGSSPASSTAGGPPAPPRKPPRATSTQQEDGYSSRLKELYYQKQLENSGDFV